VRLALKWLLWYLCIGIYVMFLGGIFYYNLFKWTFDEKLKQQSIDLVKVHAFQLIKGLSERQSTITMNEYEIMSNALAKDERIASLLYLNRFGEVRWYKDPSLIGKAFDEFNQAVPIPTDAIDKAFKTKTPKVRAVPNQPFYEVAIPLSVRGEIVGIVDMQVSRKGVNKVIAQAMNKYILGAAGVLFLLGIPLWFFLHHFVLGPLTQLRDGVEAISFKNLDLKFPTRKDEIGDVATVFSTFLQKIKAERANVMVKEKERTVTEERWWQSILTAIVSKDHRAIVVDEDNSVLYTNFPIAQKTDPNTRLHLLDIIDSQQQDVLRLVGVALDRPNQIVETDTVFQQQQSHVRAVHLEEEGELRRTLILFEPKKSVGPKI